MSDFKPMLAQDAEFNRIRYPVMASPKLDGVRATFDRATGFLRSRSLKVFPNHYLNELFKFPHALDGELIVGDAYSKTVFRDTMKVVMAQEADITGLRLHVFDLVAANEFKDRFEVACSLADYKRIIPVPHTLISSESELLELEETMLRVGYEGLMIRDPKGKYKYGRSTVNEGALLKVKRRLQAEAKVIGFEEQMHNANEAKTNALGHSERSSHQENKVPMGVLGALVCVGIGDPWKGIEFNIGTGFTAEDRVGLWKQRESLKGRIVSYEYQPIGVKDKPRHSSFLGFRATEDM
jgi:DNA ligase-1